MLVRSAVLTSLWLVSLVPSSPAPTTTRYRFELKTENTVDLSVVGQPAQITNLGLNAWVTMTLTDSASGKVVHVIVDSLKAETTIPQITPSMADSAKGGMVHGWVDPTGHIKNVTTKPSGNLLLTSVQGVVNALFPRVKPGTKSGDHWVDTTEVSNTGEGNNTKVKLILNYTADGTETVGGLPAVKVSASSTSTITGTMDNPMAGTMEVEGNGTGSGTFYIGADMRFLGGMLSSTIDQRLKVTMAPAPIPVKTVQSLTVTLIK
ncbi:MAG TPA: hypothetical protein VFU23_10580 [Gemmatimonadales bacterium]|nr:hypothetical protein [Gemmatimonadales bacterium]